MHVIKKLLDSLRQYTRASLLTPLFMVGEVIMEVILPLVMAQLIDQGIEAGDMNNTLFYGVIMLVVAFISLFCGFNSARLSAEAAAGLAANLRKDMYENIQTFSFSNIDKFSTAGLVTRMTTDVTNVQNAYMQIIRTAVRSPLMLVACIAASVSISAGLSMIYVVAIVVLAVALAFLLTSTIKIFDVMFTKYDELNASVQENVSAIRVVKAFVREDHENSKFHKAAENIYNLSVKAEGLLAINSPIMMCVVYGCILAISWFGAHYVVAGSITTGELTTMFTYVMQILMALMMLSMIFVMVSMSAASARRIVEVLDEKADLTNPEQPVAEIADGSIDFDHVGFSYKMGTGDEVLRDIDLHIESGETIGIIGGTGSGKSTLVSLISRLYDATEGEVRVGGRDVREYDMEALRDNVAVVLQKNVLFSGTILDNLRWGKEDATLEECQEACREACADEFIERFPDGYDTWIEQGGNNVSGGQKQRLCIARALLKDPKVLILDDSTSAVDTATDAKIQRAFKERIPGTTKLIISQRVSSIATADRILVLDEGEVSGFGTHEELLATNEIYRDIYETQTAGGGEGDFDEASMADAPAATTTPAAAQKGGEA